MDTGISILEIGKLRQWKSCVFDQGHRTIKRCSQVSNISLSAPKPLWDLSDIVLFSKHWLVTIRQAIWEFTLVLKEQRCIAFFLKNMWYELFPSNAPHLPIYCSLWKLYSSKVPLHLWSLVLRLMSGCLRG